MTARTYVAALAATVAFACLILAGCGSEPVESEGTVELNEDAAIMLPPGHPGEEKGSTLIIPAEDKPPAIHYANCFSGVPHKGDIGIGSAAGHTRDYIGSVVLPVNVNLGSSAMESYRVRIEVSDSALEFVPASVEGSYPWLSTSDCRDRCNSICADNPENYPDQFQKAAGFEQKPTVTPVSGGIVVEANDSDPATPTTGTVNLCNVPLKIVDELPSASGVTMDFTVESLKDKDGNELSRTPLSGTVIENIRLK